ncbi:MAG TPA: hypothetical protein VN326_12625 [Casimicrobiaceae bacterium]|jgi:hypothetical protein|nr:hypothetical protein [Casimicrobiaceae bacterium]
MERVVTGVPTRAPLFGRLAAAAAARRPLAAAALIVDQPVAQRFPGGWLI